MFFLGLFPLSFFSFLIYEDTLPSSTTLLLLCLLLISPILTSRYFGLKVLENTQESSGITRYKLQTFFTKALEKLEHHFWLITLPSRIRCIGDSPLARTINWCNGKLSIYLLTYMRVFGFMVGRGVCKYYWHDQNEPHTAHFSWPWWVMIS